jgi:hypothetical protein
MNIPFRAYIDEQELERLHLYTDGRVLTAEVTPRSEWTEAVRGGIVEPVHLYLFRTPASNYIALEQEIRAMTDQETAMGDIPTLEEYKKDRISTDLQRESLYDIFSVGQGPLENRFITGGGRISTQEDLVPPNLTLDELKLLALEDLNLTPDDAKNAIARIIPLTAWGDRGRLIIAGFNFRDDYGVMVDHHGGVSHYHNRSKEETREALGV